ncbi:MAG: biotin--[acetyl-CoA-carboxylase] ligase [Thermodesulfobacteriota bacterium]
MSGAGHRRGETDCLPAGLRQTGCQPIAGGVDEPPVFIVEACDSTMNLAWRLLAEDRFPEWASVLAESQSAGRGQFGRGWYSPPGNLYASLRLPRPGTAVWTGLLPLLLAASMHAILRGRGLPAAIKWPNDLLVAGKKVGGILVEMKSDAVIAGVGLNLAWAPQFRDLRHPLAPPAGCLREFGLQDVPRDIWMPFVRDLRARMQRSLEQDDPEQFTERLAPHLAYVDERILLDAHAAGERPVIFQGIDAGGGIRVLTADGVKIYRSGSLYPAV